MIKVLNKADKLRYQKLSDLGCLICLIHEGVYSQCEIHHLVTFPKKDNQRTIGLCYVHHREGSNCDEYVSRHPWLTEFENRYGDEDSLLEKANNLIAS